MPDRAPPEIAGILVGGRSRRMGFPKALLPHPDGGTYLEHVVNVARQAVSEVVLLGSPCFDLPAGIAGLHQLPDRITDAGPLAGLATLLAHAGERWAMLISCDLPLLTPDVLEDLRRCVRAEFDAVAFRAEEAPKRFHACCACYHGRIAGKVASRLEGGDRSLHGLLHRIRTGAPIPRADHVEALANVNSGDDYQTIRQRSEHRLHRSVLVWPVGPGKAH